MTSRETRTWVVFALALGVLLTTGHQIRGQDPDAVAALVARAGRYVQEYRRQFSAVVCEERQTQVIIRSDGRTRKRRELVSDFLLVKVGSGTMSFRDVIAVDGKPVRDRQDRLRKLFLDAPKTALKQASAVAAENTRYNIGFSRSIPALMLPLAILDPRLASRFRFALTNAGLAFDEFGSPSMIRARKGSETRDMFLQSRFVIDTDSGRLRAASLTANSTVFESTFDVRYVENPTLELLVPSRDAGALPSSGQAAGRSP